MQAIGIGDLLNPAIWHHLHSEFCGFDETLTQTGITHKHFPQCLSLIAKSSFFALPPRPCPIYFQGEFRASTCPVWTLSL